MKNKRQGHASSHSLFLGCFEAGGKLGHAALGPPDRKNPILLGKNKRSNLPRSSQSMA